MQLLRYEGNAAVSLDGDLNHTSDNFFFFLHVSFGKHFEGNVARFWDPTLRKKEKEKKELLYLSEVAAGDCMIAALKWPSGQALEYTSATGKGMQDVGCHRAARGSSFASGSGVGRLVRRTAS